MHIFPSVSSRFCTIINVTRLYLITVIHFTMHEGKMKRVSWYSALGAAILVHDVEMIQNVCIFHGEIDQWSSLFSKATSRTVLTLVSFILLRKYMQFTSGSHASPIHVEINAFVVVQVSNLVHQECKYIGLNLLAETLFQVLSELASKSPGPVNLFSTGRKTCHAWMG